MKRRLRVLAIDPGRVKCGLAVVDAEDGILALGVVPTETIPAVVRQWLSAHRPSVVVLGDGTTARRVQAGLGMLPVPLEVVAERHTTERARVRYFVENPPRGWRALFRPLLTPPVPVDDYAAVLIAEDYLKAIDPDQEPTE